MTVLAQVDLNAALQQAWNNIAAFVPKLLGFLVILLIGYFIARALAKILDKVLERVGFDRAVERGGIKQAMARSRYDASDLVSKLVYYALMLFVLQLAFGVFGPNPISDIIASIIAFLPKIFVAIVIVVIAAVIAAAAREIVDASLGGLSYGRMLANLAGAAILVIGVFAALNQLQIAPAIVNGLFYAILAIIAGSAIVAIGGGGIMPMRRKWEQYLGRMEEEAPRIRQQLQSTSTEDLKARAEQRREQARSEQADGEPAGGGH
jgi:Conserved TM helix